MKTIVQLEIEHRETHYNYLELKNAIYALKYENNKQFNELEQKKIKEYLGENDWSLPRGQSGIANIT